MPSGGEERCRPVVVVVAVVVMMMVVVVGQSVSPFRGKEIRRKTEKKMDMGDEDRVKGTRRQTAQDGAPERLRQPLGQTRTENISML